ncbi:hypothetical protein TARUN_4320 [Trichoderma arundinaceum]|uniref:Uncharacterized protein n=1 Tax=Trichoderma arundinaceum TaxID=490622 RepID=A0A395NPP7_TRIAR|nr:hypothetical protein TARUN_4320 [Trichoderma arundinaceum]
MWPYRPTSEARKPPQLVAEKQFPEAGTSNQQPDAAMPKMDAEDFITSHFFPATQFSIAWSQQRLPSAVQPESFTQPAALASSFLHFPSPPPSPPSARARSPTIQHPRLGRLVFLAS